MRILYDDAGTCQKDTKLMETLDQAARICLKYEDINSELIEISISFVSMDEIHQLNNMYRQVDSPTDVLSFPMFENIEEIREAVDMPDAASDGVAELIGVEDGEEVLLGDVVICLEKAYQQAKEYGHSREREIIYLFVHSILHLLGYDHMNEQDKAEMRRHEEIVMDALDLKRSV